MSMTKLQMGIAGALAVAGATGYVLQGETNAALRREIVAMQTPPQTVAALRAENQQLVRVVAEVEMLRRDDAELAQLSRSVAEVKTSNEKNARLAQIRAQDHRSVLEAQIREADKRAQEEVNRMNREGNALVNAYKYLNEMARKETLTIEQRAQTEARAKAKLEEIQNKQREIQVFIENTRRVLAERAAEVRRLYPNVSEPSGVPLSSPSGGRLELRRPPPSGGESNNPPSVSGSINFVPKP